LILCEFTMSPLRLQTQSGSRNRRDGCDSRRLPIVWGCTEMSGEFWLSDEAWAAIDPLLPKVYSGARRHDDRRIISGIMHVLRSGCRWQDCPAVYGPSTTIYNRFHRWSKRGLWEGVFEALVETVPNDTRSIDSTSIKVQRAAAGGKGGPRNRPSAARGGAGPPKSMRSPTAKGDCSASC